MTVTKPKQSRIHYVAFTDNLITMLWLLKNTTFSTAIDSVSDIMQNVRIIFEISETRLLEALCDVKTEGKLDVRPKYSKRKNPV